MATQSTPIYDTLSGTDQANLDLKVADAGTTAFDFVRTAGSIDVKVQISLDGGTTFVDAYDAGGVQLTVRLTSSRPHKRIEILSQSGTQYRVVSTDVSSGAAQTKFGPVLAPH